MPNTYEKETSLYFNTYSEIPLLKLSFKVSHVSTSKPFHHVVLWKWMDSVQKDGKVLKLDFVWEIAQNAKHIAINVDVCVS